MYIKKMKVIILIASIFILSACLFSKKTQVQDIEYNNIELYIDSMERINPQRSIREKYDDSIALRFVVFMDSLDCTSCNLARLNDWNAVMAKSNRVVPVKFVFIFDISTNKRLDIIEMYKRTYFFHDIYLDTNHVAIRQNPILKQSIYHNIMIGKDGKILYVGNPVNNIKSEDKLMQILRQLNVEKN